ncbi:hypothetical protein BaRGS_00027387 [Batillaria attramentaria]|uniref:Uncharacterized protein n=1 Tax=Batillaria attramentaria TaxID=370345 RepID=A0ABD0K297_9CAEN
MAHVQSFNVQLASDATELKTTKYSYTAIWWSEEMEISVKTASEDILTLCTCSTKPHEFCNDTTLQPDTEANLSNYHFIGLYNAGFQDFSDSLEER